MMKIVVLILISLNPVKSFTQEHKKQNDNFSPQSINAVAYRLYSTQNMWNFIKLDTRNGLMWQVQFDIKGNNRLVTNLNLIPLITKEKEVNDRFTLYTTQNISTFILLDQFDGRTWQVQWSIDEKNRAVIPIE